MYEDRAALVVENAGKLYVADTWTRKEYALYDDEFSQVAVGGFTFRRTFAASEVLFFELAAQDAKLVVDGLYESYAKLIACGMKGYQKSRGEKGTLELDANAAGDKRFQETFEEIKNQGFRRFAEAENAVLPMWKGMKYTSLASKTYNSDTTGTSGPMIDDVTDFTARGLASHPPCSTALCRTWTARQASFSPSAWTRWPTTFRRKSTASETGWPGFGGGTM